MSATPNNLAFFKSKSNSAAALFQKYNVLLHLIEKAPTSNKSRVWEEEK